MVKYFSPLPYYRKLTLHKINANFLFALIYVALIFVTYSFFHFIHSFIRSFVRSFVRSLVHLWTLSFIRLFIRLFAYSFTHSFLLFIHWLTDSFLSSFLSLQPTAVLEGAWEAVLVVAVVAGRHIMRHSAAYADRPPAVAWDPWQV